MQGYAFSCLLLVGPSGMQPPHSPNKTRHTASVNLAIPIRVCHPYDSYDGAARLPASQQSISCVLTPTSIAYTSPVKSQGSTCNYYESSSFGGLGGDKENVYNQSVSSIN